MKTNIKRVIGLFLPDKLYLSLRYKSVMHKKLNWKNPRTFNEKIQWLKLYERKPVYTIMVDKYEAKKYAAGRIGEEHIIPTLGVWNYADEIDFDALPDQFVLKCTHDSASVEICENKKDLDRSAVTKKLKRCLERNYYHAGREWPYKNVRPRIIAEEYMHDGSENGLKDYKFFCFNGEPKLIQVDYDRFSGHKRNMYDTEWNYLEMMLEYPTDPKRNIPAPERLGDMLCMAGKLSGGTVFARVDLYSTGSQIYFGEITFYPGCGLEKFVPELWDMKLGDWVKLPTRGGVILSINNIYILVLFPARNTKNTRIRVAA